MIKNWQSLVAHGAVVPLVGLLFGVNYPLHEAVINSLAKLGKNQPLCKIDMIKARVVENIPEILPEAPNSLCVVMAELLRIVKNNDSIAKGTSATKVVKPLFSALTRPDFSVAGQHSAMQVLVNILENPQWRDTYKLTPSQAVEPLIPLLDSPSQAMQ